MALSNSGAVTRSDPLPEESLSSLAVLLLSHKRSPSKEKYDETLEEVLKLAWEDSEAGRECREQLDAVVLALRQMDPREYWHVREWMVLDEVVGFLREHPGSVCKDEGGYRASRPFRRFVLRLTEPGQGGSVLTVEQLSDVTGVPLPMLQSWLRKKAKGKKRRKR